MANQREQVIARLRKEREDRAIKKESDSLKAKRTYAEEVKKAKPETGDQAITRLTQEY